MEFSVDVWQAKVGESLRGLDAGALRLRAQDTAYVLYGTLCGLTVYPLVATVGAGDYAGAFMALGNVLGGIGSNLVANMVQEWKDNPPSAAAVQEAMTENVATNAPLRAELDALMEKLEVIPQAQAELDAAERAWFAETLRAELAALGNLARHEVHIEGSYAGGNQTAGRDFVGRDQVITINVGWQGAPFDLQREPDLARLRAAYLQYLRETYQHLDFKSLPQVERIAQQVPLDAVYVPLRARPETPRWEAGLRVAGRDWRGPRGGKKQ